MQKLLDDVGELLGQGFPDFRTGVFARHVAADGDKLVDGDVVPVVDVFLYELHHLELLLGIIDESAEVAELRVADLVAEKLVHFSLDVARSILQHMLE